MKQILIINGHPNKESFCSSISQSYFDAAKQFGSNVELVHLVDLKFDPILRYGFQKNQELEPDLLQMQKKISVSEHIVWVYPNWWGSLPALLKGFIDRCFLPGFAFKYNKDSVFQEKLFLGKTSEIILTLDTPAWFYRWFMGAPGLKAMKTGVLEFCGLKVRHTKLIGPIRDSTSEQRQKWLQQVKSNIGVSR